MWIPPEPGYKPTARESLRIRFESILRSAKDTLEPEAFAGWVVTYLPELLAREVDRWWEEFYE